MPTKTHTLAARSEITEPTLLSEYDPNATQFLQEVFGAQSERRLPAAELQVAGGLVIAHMVAPDGRDTFYYHEAGMADLARVWFINTPAGASVLGRRIHTLGGKDTRTDNDGNPVLLLESVDTEGNAIELPTYFGVEVSEAAVGGLWVYTSGHFPPTLRQVDPYQYIEPPDPH